MKIFAGLLLLLNVVYLAWIQFAGPPPLPENTGALAAGNYEFTQAGEKLTLVSERPAATPQAARIDLPAAEVESPAPQEVPWCAVASGFEDSAVATAFLSAVNALGGQADLQSSQEPVASTWWVHLPPFPSEEAASSTLAELQAKKIDSFYIRTGELSGAISLGVFSRPESAAVAQQELAAKGYAAAVREIFRMGTRFSVSVRLEDSQLREQAGWANIEANLQTAELQEIACK